MKDKKGHGSESRVYKTKKYKTKTVKPASAEYSQSKFEKNRDGDYHSAKNWERRTVAMDPNVKDKVFTNGRLTYGAGRRW